MAPKKRRKTKRPWTSRPAATGAVDAGKIDVEKVAAELDHQIRMQQLAKGNDLNQGNVSLESQITQIFIAILAGIFSITLILKWCQDRGEAYRTKYAVMQAKKRRARERRSQQSRASM